MAEVITFTPRSHWLGSQGEAHKEKFQLGHFVDAPSNTLSPYWRLMDTNGLHGYFQDFERQDTYSGVVLLTRDDHELFSGAYGFAHRGWKIPNTLDVRFDTASITKLFTAIAVLQCVERQEFSLQTRVTAYLDLSDTQISPEVTVLHCLTHTSGIADDADEEAGEEYEDVWRDKPNYSVLETRDFLPQFVFKPANFAPGSGVRYNNCAFVLLGLMLERATGRSYREYVEEQIFQPAQMDHSGFFRMDRATEQLAEGYDPVLDDASPERGWKKNIYSYPPIGSPDGGAHVTARDLTAFMTALRSGKLLSPTNTAAMFEPRVLARQNEICAIHNGFALEFHTEPDGELMFYGKEGINAGTSAWLRHYPARNLTLVMLSNLSVGVWGPCKHIHELIQSGKFD